jgi:hypothetical protein
MVFRNSRFLVLQICVEVLQHAIVAVYVSVSLIAVLS